MCGIVGIIGIDSDKRVQEMLNLLEHRGPDARGIWKSDKNLSLGHVRLSINDLSEAGNQPMFSEDGNIVLVANGEIYNYLELRKELELKGIKFNSNSDSEVIIYAWKAWGHKCFQMLNGMFAFALFDHKNNELIMVRDRMGIKPLYYSELNDEFIFSSEIKSIVAVMKSKNEIDPIGLNQYLTYQNYFGQRSLYKGIKLLLPGHYLTIKLDQRKKLEPFCSFNFTKDSNIDFDQAVTKYKNTIESSVQRHLLSDVPVASYLSAGFDSSTVLNRASINGKAPDSFTGTFQEGGWYDETSTASKIARYNGSAFNAVNIFPENLPEMMDHLIDTLDEPRMGIGAFSQYCVAKKVAETHKVILTGHGGDELFSGYPVFKFVSLINKIKKNPFNIYKLISKNFLSELPHMIYFGLNLFRSQTYHQYLPVLNSPLVLQQGLKPEWAKLIQDQHPEDELIELDNKCNNEEDVLFNHYLQAYLNGLLVVEDKISMAHSLESRTPFLDNEMLDLSLSIPQSLKLHNGNLKAIVKEGGKDWLPEILYNEPKRGFPTPLNKWLRGPLREWFINKITGEQSGLHYLFKSKWLEKTCNHYLNSYTKNFRPLDEIQTQRMWQLLSLESWLRKNNFN
jgi:asparagine synthase (glutamine-hydrolysing)